MIFNPIREIDRLLNSLTMYRLLVYGLVMLLVVAEIFGITGTLPLLPAHLIGTTAVLLVATYISNKLFSKSFKVFVNRESWLITALILACIVPPVITPPRVLAVALIGVLASAVKYLLLHRKSHIVNPAAAAAVFVTLLKVLPITWWIGSPTMLPFVIIFGVLVLRKTRRFELFMTFAGAALVLGALVGILHSQSVIETWRLAILSGPLVFMGTIMLTEPTTLPAGRQNLWLYGLLVGCLYSAQLRLGLLSTSPHMVLIVGNIAALAMTPKQGLRVQLKKITRLAPNIYDIAFEVPKGKQLQFKAGQYIEWTLPSENSTDDRGNRRTFTIASAPTQKDLHLGIKTYVPSSTYKAALIAMKPGDVMQVAHVGGSFTLPDDPAEKLLFVAGGIGITPFVSMVQYLTDINQKRDIILFYSVRNTADAVYLEVFKNARKLGIKLIIETDFISASVLKKAVPDAASRKCYISGPDAMVHACQHTLSTLGVSHNRIHTDLFAGY